MPPHSQPLPAASEAFYNLRVMFDLIHVLAKIMIFHQPQILSSICNSQDWPVMSFDCMPRSLQEQLQQQHQLTNSALSCQHKQTKTTTAVGQSPPAQTWPKPPHDHSEEILSWTHMNMRNKDISLGNTMQQQQQQSSVQCSSAAKAYCFGQKACCSDFTCGFNCGSNEKQSK